MKIENGVEMLPLPVAGKRRPYEPTANVRKESRLHMPLARDMNEMPYSGLPASDVIDALAFASAKLEWFKDHKIIAMLPRDDGRLYIKTGEWRGTLAGGGVEVLLGRGSEGWELINMGSWLS